MLKRRGLLSAFLAAPVIIRTPGLLMPVRAVVPVSRLDMARDYVRLTRLTPEVWDAAFFAEYVRKNRFAQYMRAA
jgi:hypothetical protein